MGLLQSRARCPAFGSYDFQGVHFQESGATKIRSRAASDSEGLRPGWPMALCNSRKPCTLHFGVLATLRVFLWAFTYLWVSGLHHPFQVRRSPKIWGPCPPPPQVL